ncbi:D-glycerate dehydrogenase [bacterium]|jgi:lactate dehydrogenase-like 2-hydroxyacid dehydrogenase|nr:D-glycerate dehydrogenase [bacterium]MDP6571418.1 D-glycerate dehydrogenase [Patescibacteria group bacterium]MDP6756395.1 D-glycerate dehydrogenase [Patescibacteria group bacterium]|tara:strand:+ start:14729 stop:15700 length:972 start_codon:yes stop_codon:yes gene_type:complete
MKKPLVIIARNIPKEGLEELYKHCRVQMHKDSMPPSRSELLSYSSRADALITVLTEKVDAELLSSAKSLKIVANYAVGFDNIDLKAAKKAGIYATNTPGNLGSAVAEQAMGMILVLSKKMLQGDRFMRANKYKAWDPNLLLGNNVGEKTLGIIGVGNIGSVLVKIAHDGFGMKILYHDVIQNKEIEKAQKAKRVSLSQLLKTSDAVSVHVPLLPSTKHLIGASELNQMKETAVLVNTSRGPVIDEKALVKALKANKIAGAGLDVFEFEPKMAPGLAKLENIVLTPHIASATIEARTEMGEIATQNILDVLIRGKKPRNELKPE